MSGGSDSGTDEYELDRVSVGRDGDEDGHTQHPSDLLWGEIAQRYMILRIISLILVIASATVVGIKWTCTEQSSPFEVEETTFLLARSEELLETWKHDMSRHFALKFKNSNDKLTDMITELTGKATQMQVNLTEAIKLQGQQIDDISATSDYTTDTLSSFQSLLTSNVDVLSEVMAKNVQTLGHDIVLHDSNQTRLLSDVADSVDGSRTKAPVLINRYSKNSNELKPLNETLKSFSQSFSWNVKFILDEQQTQLAVVKASLHKLSTCNTTLKQNRDVIRTTSLHFQSATKKMDSLIRQQNGVGRDASTVTAAIDNIESQVGYITHMSYRCKSTIPRQDFYQAAMWCLVSAFLSQMSW